jgi:prevent-host-death family protein
VQVGVRELRDQLRKWLDAVRRGEEITVTERGKPIARLIGASSPEPLDRLIAQGIVTPPRGPRRASGAYGRVKGRPSVSDLIPEQRR